MPPTLNRYTPEIVRQRSFEKGAPERAATHNGRPGPGLILRLHAKEMGCLKKIQRRDLIGAKREGQNGQKIANFPRGGWTGWAIENPKANHRQQAPCCGEAGKKDLAGRAFQLRWTRWNILCRAFARDFHPNLPLTMAGTGVAWPKTATGLRILLAARACAPIGGQILIDGKPCLGGKEFEMEVRARHRADNGSS